MATATDTADDQHLGRYLTLGIELQHRDGIVAVELCMHDNICSRRLLNAGHVQSRHLLGRTRRFLPFLYRLQVQILFARILFNNMIVALVLLHPADKARLNLGLRVARFCEVLE